MAAKPTHKTAGKAADKAASAPLKSFIGFIPEATRKDAQEFAAGIAAKHCTSPENSYYGVTDWRGGFAYEVHEGGPGKALLPSILAEFDRTADLEDVEPVKHAYIHAGMRTVKVNQTQNGVASVLLPEDQQHPQSEFVKPGKNLQPWLPRKTNVLFSGAAVFVVGALVLTWANNGRIQPYEAPPPKKIEKVSLDALPISQMARMFELSQQNKLVTGVSMANGTWDVIHEDKPDPNAAAAAPAEPGVKP